MGYSPLITETRPAHPNNYTKGRDGSKIWGIIIHHGATTNLDSIGATFQNPNRHGSAHYGVGGSRIVGYVEEQNGAWHCSDYWGNMGSIGIENTNSATGGDWPISDETFDTLVKLVADIAKRNNLGWLKFEPDGYCPNLSAHRDWAATACPGDYLYRKMNELADRANAINYPPEPAPEPEPTPTIEWVDTPETTMKVKDGGANLVNITTGAVVKTLGGGEDFTYVQKTSDGAYVRTQYSKDKNISNGVLLSDLVPIPEPEPTPEPDPTPEPEPTPEPDPSDETPNWFIRFIHALGEFFTHLFTGKEK